MNIKEQVDLKIEEHLIKYKEKHENLAIIIGHNIFHKFKSEIVESSFIKTHWDKELKYMDCDVIINLVYPEMIEVARKILPGEQSPGGSKGGTDAALDSWRKILDLISKGVMP